MGQKPKKKTYLHLLDLFSQTGAIASAVFTRNADLLRTFRHLEYCDGGTKDDRKRWPTWVVCVGFVEILVRRSGISNRIVTGAKCGLITPKLSKRAEWFNLSENGTTAD